MASYPTYPQHLSSFLAPVGGQEMDVMTDGQPRIRNFYDAQSYVAVVVHLLGNSDLVALLQFYLNNDSVNFDFTFTGDPAPGSSVPTSYTMLFTRAIEYRTLVPGAAPADMEWRVTVNMAGVPVFA